MAIVYQDMRTEKQMYAIHWHSLEYLTFHSPPEISEL